MVISGVFGFVDEIGGEDVAFVVGDFGRGIFAKNIADSIDVFGGSFKIFVGGNASVFVFDAGVFETIIEYWLTASS